MDAKISGYKFDLKQDIFMISKYLPQDTYHLEKHSNFTVEKTDINQLNQVIKVSFTNNTVYGYNVPLPI